MQRADGTIKLPRFAVCFPSALYVATLKSLMEQNRTNEAGQFVYASEGISLDEGSVVTVGTADSRTVAITVKQTGRRCYVHPDDLVK